jgi:transcription antitermination factor NusG
VPEREIDRIRREEEARALAIREAASASLVPAIPPLFAQSAVDVIDGLFKGESGTYVGERRGKARVLLTRLGKELPVELPFAQIVSRG